MYIYKLPVPLPTLGHSQGDSFTNPILITAFAQVRPKSHWEPPSEVGSINPAELLAGFEPRIHEHGNIKVRNVGRS